jgi:hypothetical protein
MKLTAADAKKWVSLSAYNGEKFAHRRDERADESHFSLFTTQRFKLEKLIARSVTKSDLWLDSQRAVCGWFGVQMPRLGLTARLAPRKHTNMGFGGALAAQEKFVLFAARAFKIKNINENDNGPTACIIQYSKK